MMAKCIFCGNDFTPTRVGNVYCSVRCRRDADLERRKIRGDTKKKKEILERDKKERQHIPSRYYMPPLDKMSGDELLHYGKHQTIIFTGGKK